VELYFLELGWGAVQNSLRTGNTGMALGNGSSQMNVNEAYYLVLHRGKMKWYSRRDPTLERWLFRNQAHITQLFVFGIK
jgi:hypothetical protein